LRSTYLDLGCGNGSLTELLSPLFLRSIAIDVEVGRLLDFLKHLPAHGSRTLIVRAEAQQLPLDDSCVDFVSSFEVLEHLPFLEASLDELARVTKTSALVVVSVPQVGFPFENHGMRLGRWTLERKIPLLPYFPPLHRRFALARVFSSRKLDRLFFERGFDVVATEYVTPQFERAATRNGSWESRLSFLRDFLERLTAVPGLRVLVGVSILKAYRKRA
jgi:ubiquinone/menaquinone biosynthesis C-methylase UbiE